MSSTLGESKKVLAALFVVDMGNYDRNSLSLPETLLSLRKATQDVEFVGYHRRRSGNFVFVDSGDSSLGTAQLIGQRVTQLPCLVRRYADLRNVRQAVPSKAYTTPQGSIEIATSNGPRKIIWVGLSEDVHQLAHFTGSLNSRGTVCGCTSVRDVLCFYDRPSSGGNVGQVTRAIEKSLRQRGMNDHIVATGRALSVLGDLLEGKGITWVAGFDPVGS